MLRTPLVAILLALAATAAAQQPLSSANVGKAFCAAMVSGDMEPVLPLLTGDLAETVAAHAENGIPWQLDPGPLRSCMTVGNTGTAERPETVLSLVYAETGRRSFTQNLVMVFVDGTLRIDDIAFAGGSTLRAKLDGE